LANDYDNGDLSIDSFGRAFQKGTEGAISGVAFGFGLGVTSAIPIVGNLAVAGILTHGAITGAERTGEAFGQGRYATGIFELGNAYLGVKAAGNHFGQGVADVQGSWQRGEIQSLARNTTSVIGEIWSNTGSRLFDRGYAIGETMPNGLIAGMGPGGAFKGEFNSGFISGDTGVIKQKLIEAVKDTDALGEINAAKALRSEGINVHFRIAAGDQGVQKVRTADFFVGGERGTGNGGQIFDVITPSTSNAGRIISAVAKKMSQADRVVINLDKTSLTVEDLGNIIPCVNGVMNISRPLQEVIFVKNQTIIARIRK
jgi:hypothetical protein